MDKKEQILAWLKRERPYLNITAIGRDLGITNLLNILDERADGRGYLPKLADKHVPTLEAFIEAHCKP